MNPARRYAALVLLAGMLAGCADKAVAPSATQAAKPVQGGCEQSDWQAQTAPVINKRLGPEVLEQYDAEHPEQGGCH